MFEVGDIVKVKSFEEIQKSNKQAFATGMKQFCETTHKVVHVYNFGGVKLEDCYEEEDGEKLYYFFWNQWLTLVCSPSRVTEDEFEELFSENNG